MYISFLRLFICVRYTHTEITSVSPTEKKNFLHMARNSHLNLVFLMHAKILDKLMNIQLR